MKINQNNKSKQIKKTMDQSKWKKMTRLSKKKKNKIKKIKEKQTFTKFQRKNYKLAIKLLYSFLKLKIMEKNKKF